MTSFIAKKKPIITISGATGTGKTSSSIHLAQKLKQQLNIDCEIINFDSIQFYKQLDIASAKPDDNELSIVPHHLIGIKNFKEEMNASEFCDLATPIVEKLHKENKLPILVGGSGFYIRAFVKGMFESKTVSEKTRKMVEEILEKEGSNGIRLRIQEVDPESFEKLHHNDNYRNCRALEHWIETGTKFSDKSKSIADPFDFSDQKNKNYNFLHFYAFIEKEDHFPLLQKRTKAFFEDQKLFKEIFGLFELGATGEEKSLQSIGYKEVVHFCKEHKLEEGQSPEPKLLDELIERIFISTRQLVKAQKTFFKKVQPKVQYNPVSELNILSERSAQFLKKLDQN
jgi:tRNA dimethylallyltransferase